MTMMHSAVSPMMSVHHSATQFELPKCTGIGLKPEHFTQITQTWPNLGFVEIHAENYMVDGGPFHHYLTRIRDRYPLSIHGVGLSIGGADELNQQHLQALRKLLDRYAPQSFSEHLAWSSHNDVFINDLLPLPYTQHTLQRVCDHIDQTQNFLQRSMLLENPSTYVEFATSTMSETDFISAVIQRTGCGLLLDVNNVYVSCVNHGLDPHTYIRALPHHAIGEIHLAGHTETSDDLGAALLIDSHATPIAQTVWQLYEYSLIWAGAAPTLIERDGDVPELNVLLEEVHEADQLLCQAMNREKTPYSKGNHG